MFASQDAIDATDEMYNGREVDESRRQHVADTIHQIVERPKRPEVTIGDYLWAAYSVKYVRDLLD